MISKKLRIKWNFELTVFELTMCDLYPENEESITSSVSLHIYNVLIKVEVYIQKEMVNS